MQKDRIDRPVHVGDHVQYRYVENHQRDKGTVRETVTVVELVGKYRVRVRKLDGSTAVWYADNTMLV